jgi:hypothetical protein
MSSIFHALLICTAIVGAALADEPLNRVDAIAGLWKFPEKAVWIQVNSDGTLFQCRMGGDQLFVSRGKFQTPDSFVWESFWGTERIEHSSGSLTVYHAYKPGSYVRARGPMSPECQKRRESK